MYKGSEGRSKKERKGAKEEEEEGEERAQKVTTTRVKEERTTLCKVLCVCVLCAAPLYIGRGKVAKLGMGAGTCTAVWHHEEGRREHDAPHRREGEQTETRDFGKVGESEG